MNANLKRWAMFAVLPVALLALVLAGMPMGARAELGKAMTGSEMVAAANTAITTISVDQAKELLGKPGVIFLDVREADEIAKGSIPGAVVIPRGMLEFSAANNLPNKDAKIVVYCAVGGRGALATETLAKMGYTNAVNMAGGWKAWVAGGGAAK
jgi:rhodanese-related sulfurtransferase